MTAAQRDGGPAFPVVSDGHTHGTEPGMTLRDYFAAKAMTALLGSDRVMALSDVLADQHGFHRATWVAGQAYGFADAMLTARMDPQPGENT